jgi:hypothetical protein
LSPLKNCQPGDRGSTKLVEHIWVNLSACNSLKVYVEGIDFLHMPFKNKRAEFKHFHAQGLTLSLWESLSIWNHKGMVLN